MIHYADDQITLHHGKSLDVLRSMPDTSVDCCVTSPPYYGLRDYGVDGQYGLEKTSAEYVENMRTLFAEVRRVLAKDGTFWLNLGDSYANGGGSNNGGYSAKSTLRNGNVRDGEKYRDANDNTVRVAIGHDLPAKNLLGIPWRVAFALQDDGWILRNAIIWSKCLSGGTRMYARVSGRPISTTLKDLARYDVDTIELWTGERWSRVLRIDPTPPTEGRSESSAAARMARYRGKPIPRLVADLEIEFRNGERVGCTPNHKWPTQRGEVRADELLIGDVVATGCLPDEPDSEPAGLPDEEVGWFVGMYLAEGSRSAATIQIAGHLKETDRNKRLAAIAAAYHGTCKVFQTSDNGLTANLTGPALRAILDTYIAGRTAKDKRLASRCWQRSNRFLDALLRGYLEGDGHRRTDTAEWRVGFTANDGLACDLRTVGARLGLSVHLRRAVHQINGRAFPGWRGSIRESDTRRCPDGQVIAIRQSRARQFWNVEIVDEPHLFALASGIRTRNSNAMPESVTDRLSNRYEHLFLFTRSRRYWFDLDPIREPHSHT
jgi:hypothetical protein